MLTYTSPDRNQSEAVRVLLNGPSMRATGYIVSMGELAYGASYSVLTDVSPSTTRLSVRCDNAEGERSLTVTRSANGPWLAGGPSGDSPMPQLQDATDIYLGGSAFAGSLALRRLWLQRDSDDAVREATVTVASISLPSLAVKAVQHHGRIESADDGGGRIAYSGPFGDRMIVVDKDGLILEVEGLSRRLG